eukprot:gene5382-6715_t
MEQFTEVSRLLQEKTKEVDDKNDFILKLSKSIEALRIKLEKKQKSESMLKEQLENCTCKYGDHQQKMIGNKEDDSNNSNNQLIIQQQKQHIEQLELELEQQHEYVRESENRIGGLEDKISKLVKDNKELEMKLKGEKELNSNFEIGLKQEERDRESKEKERMREREKDRQEIEKLKAKVLQSESDIDKLQVDLEHAQEELRQKRREEQKQQFEYRGKYQDQSSQIQDLTDQIQDQQKKIQDLKNQLKDEQLKLNSALAESAAATAAARQSASVAAAASSSTLNPELEKLYKQQKEIDQKTIRELTKARENDQQSIQQLTRDYEEIKEKSTHDQQVIDKLLKSKEVNIDRLEKLKVHYNELKNEYYSTRDQLTQSLQKIYELESIIKKKDDDITNFNKMVQEREFELEGSINNNAIKSNEITNLRLQVKRIREEFYLKTLDFENNSALQEAYNRDLSQSKQEIMDLQSENHNLRDQLENKTWMDSDATNAYKDLETIHFNFIKEVEQESAKSKDFIKNLCEEIESSKVVISNLEFQTNDQREMISELQTSNSKLETIRSQLEKKISDLNNQHFDAINKKDERISQIETEANQKLDQLHKEYIKSIEIEIGKHQSDLDTFTNNLRTLVYQTSEEDMIESSIDQASLDQLQTLLESRIEQLKARNQTHIQMINQSMAENDQQFKQLDSMLVEKFNRLSELEQSLKMAKLELSEFKENLKREKSRELQKQHDLLEREKREIQYTVKSLELDLSQKFEENKLLTSKLESLQNSIRDMSKSSTDYQNSAIKELEKLKQEYEDLRQKNNILAHEKAKIENSLTTTIKQNEFTHGIKVQSLEKEVTDLLSLAKTYERKLQNNEINLEQKDQQASLLNQKIQQYQQQLDHLQKYYKQQQQQQQQQQKIEPLSISRQGVISIEDIPDSHNQHINGFHQQQQQQQQQHQPQVNEVNINNIKDDLILLDQSYHKLMDDIQSVDQNISTMGPISTNDMISTTSSSKIRPSQTDPPISSKVITEHLNFLNSLLSHPQIENQPEFKEKINGIVSGMKTMRVQNQLLTHELDERTNMLTNLSESFHKFEQKAKEKHQNSKLKMSKMISSTSDTQKERQLINSQQPKQQQNQQSKYLNQFSDSQQQQQNNFIKPKEKKPTPVSKVNYELQVVPLADNLTIKKTSQVSKEAERQLNQNVIIDLLRNNPDFKLLSSFYLSNWDILAPFPAAPREDVDILEAFGGITGIPRADKTTYPSDLVFGGYTGWSKIIVSNGNVNIGYNSTQVNFPLIESWAGSSGSYFSGWGLSDFTLESEQYVIVSCVGVSRFYLDDEVMQGDTYGSGISFNARLLPVGNHTVRVRISGSEGAGYQCSVNLVDMTVSTQVLFINDVLVPDIIDGAFASPYVSITILNLMNQSLELVSGYSSQSQVQFSLMPSPGPIQIGQSIPVNLMILNKQETVNCPPGQTFSVPISLSSELNQQLVNVMLNFSCKTFGDAFIFTFLDQDQSVQYAAATPPITPCPSTGCPVLLTLHGAGVEAKSTAWTGAYQRQNYSWTLFPTNRRNYGFDWQGPGGVNAWTSLDYLATDTPGVNQSMSQYYGNINQYQLQYAGHSMGGHGCFELSTHYPDRALSVSVAAGWISMELYTPYFLRLGDSWSDPWVRFLLDASISEYKSDQYSQHLAGIPMIVRMGSDDDNVPPYHLRRMNRLYDQVNGNGVGVVSEIPGQGHWFSGVVDDATMQAFFDKYVLAGIPKLPQQFLITTLNPASSGGKGGITILQLTTPYRVGKINVVQNNQQQWTLTTENVKRFGFHEFPQKPNSIVVDGINLSVGQYIPVHYCLTSSPGTKKNWAICQDNSWQWSERSPLDYGPLAIVIQYPILIVYGTIGTESDTQFRQKLGVYLSNVFYYQERYSITVISDAEFTTDMLSTYNVIFLGGPTTNKGALRLESSLPVQFNNDGSFSIGGSQFSGSDIGIVFLASCNQGGSQYRMGCMVSVIEGTDNNGLETAVMMFPTKSNIPVPDFAVAGPTYGYTGSSGLLALGFWSNTWSYDQSISYIKYQS